MNDGEIAQTVDAFQQAGWLALAFEILVFSAAVGLLLPLFRTVVRRTGMRLLGSLAFLILAVGAYAATFISSMILQDHYVYNRTGTFSLCHLTGLVGKLAPLVAAVVGLIAVRAHRHLVDKIVGSLLFVAAIAFMVLVASLWYNFPQPPVETNFITFAPPRNTLGFVAGPCLIVCAAGMSLVVRHRGPQAAV